MSKNLMDLERNDPEGAMRCYRASVMREAGANKWRRELWADLVQLQDDPTRVTKLLAEARADPRFDARLNALIELAK